MKNQKTLSAFQKVELTPKNQNAIKGGFTSQEEEVCLAVENIALDLGTLDLL